MTELSHPSTDAKLKRMVERPDGNDANDVSAKKNMELLHDDCSMLWL